MRFVVLKLLLFSSSLLIIISEVVIASESKQAEFEKDLLKFLNPDNFSCLSTRPLIDNLLIEQKSENLNFPEGINLARIENYLADQIKKIPKQKIEDCFDSMIIYMKCGQLQNDIFNLSRLSRQRYVKKSFDSIYSSGVSNCNNPVDRAIAMRIRPMLTEIVENSKVNAFEHLKKKLIVSIGVEDHRPIYDELKLVAEVTGRPDLIEEVLRMPTVMNFPHSDETDALIEKRRQSCSDIDNTNIFVKKDYDQGKTASCFSFGAANLMNFHLGMNSVSPLFLYTLALTNNDAPWYSLQDPFVSSNSQYNGGFASGAINEALKLGRVCLKDDLYDPRTGGVDLRTVIKKAERDGKKAIKLREKFKNGIITQEQYVIKLKAIFEKEESATRLAFPKASFLEFEKIVSQSDNQIDYFRKMVLSQCKTKLSPRQRQMKVRTSYSFGPKSIDLSKIDELVENGEVAALGIHAGYAFQQDLSDIWTPHIVTLTGRRWNAELNVCEFRIVNSWGGECKGIINLDISCDDNQQLWVRESFIRGYGNSLTRIIESPALDERKLQQESSSYEDYDPEF